MEAIRVYVPPEIIEYILTFSEDEMYTVFALTSKYWYEKSRSPAAQWWKRRYLQLGGFLPPENTIPLKLLYDDKRTRYGDTLIIIGDTMETHYIVGSYNINNRSGTTFLETCKGDYLLVENGKILRKTTKDELVWGERWTDSDGKLYLGMENIPLDFIATDNSRSFVLDSDRKLHYIKHGTPDRIYPIDHIDLPSLKNVVDITGAYCLTYDQKLYKIDVNFRDPTQVSTELVTDIPEPLISLHEDTYGIYFISENNIYYRDQEDVVGMFEIRKVAHTSSPVRQIAMDEYAINFVDGSTYYISENKLYKCKHNTGEPVEIPLNLRYIIDVKCNLGNVYVLGRK